MQRLLLVLLLIAAGCGGGEAPASEDLHRDTTAVPDETQVLPEVVTRTPARDSARDEWIETAFLPNNAKLADVIRVFGQPDSLIAIPQPNDYDAAQTDTVFQVVYADGLRVWIYRVTGGNEFMSSAEIRSNRFLRDSTPGIGSEWSEVVDAFGPPWGEMEGVPYYGIGSAMGPDEPVFFDTEDGRVNLIRFSYYTG